MFVVVGWQHLPSFIDDGSTSEDDEWSLNVGDEVVLWDDTQNFPKQFG
jgi:hypothetical protein